MYANLRVTFASGKTVYAWEVERTDDALLVKLDNSDGSGRDPDEGGTLTLNPTTRYTIEASY